MMVTAKRSTYDEGGAYCRIIEFDASAEASSVASSSEDAEFDEDQPFDTVLVRFDPDRENIFTVRATDDGETVYTNAFEVRELSFDPISVLGMGERERLTGVSENTPSVGGDRRRGDGGTHGQPDGGDDHLPDALVTALNSLGFAAVPQGDDWL